MRHISTIVTTVLSTLLLAGCGGNTTGSCDTRPLNGACEDYEGSADIVAQYEGACSSDKGTWSDSLCDHSKSVGGCRRTDESLQLTLTDWVFPPDATTDAEKQQCTAPSTFVAP